MLNEARSQVEYVSDEAPHSNGNTGAAVDLTRIQETSGGDLEFERELIDVFLEDNDARAARLVEVVGRGDLPAVKREAHTLKGSSANVGASAQACSRRSACAASALAPTFALEPFKVCASRFEQACAAADVDAARGAFAQVRDELARVKSYLRAYLTTLPAGA